MRALVAARGVVLHGEQVGQRQPDLGAEQFGERLGRMRIALVAKQIFS